MKEFRSSTDKIKQQNVVPGTYMQAYGVQSETRPNVLFKLASHEAAYLDEVAVYKKHMDRKIRDLSRHQKRMLKKSPLRQISKMVHPSALSGDDDNGNITPIHLPAILKIHKHEEITIGSIEHFANQRKMQLKQAGLRRLYKSKWKLVQKQIPKLVSSNKQKKEENTTTLVRFKLSDKTEKRDADGISYLKVEKKDKSTEPKDKKMEKNANLRPITHPSSILKKKKSNAFHIPKTAPDNYLTKQKQSKLPGGLRLPPLNELGAIDSPKIQHPHPARLSPQRKRVVSLDSYLDVGNHKKYTSNSKRKSLPTLIPNGQLAKKNNKSNGNAYENLHKRQTDDNEIHGDSNGNIEMDSLLKSVTERRNSIDQSAAGDGYEMLHQIAENKRMQEKTLNTRRMSWKDVLPKIRECLHFSKDTSS
ncbi:unnamed protein product [Owenia fusiformis]|uniref:Uncharacterized protein n=1 Tax=Owenia fusiformis TaxID=6347 RepID=A0A8J1TW26_OWEFU|nr:unnamed protein product [Owenia fusiformis]